MTAAGFTGTREGMTDAQLTAVRAWLEKHPPSVLHHGAGPRRSSDQGRPSADAQVVTLCQALGIWTHAHPGPIGVPEGFPASCVTSLPKGWLVRDRDIAWEVANDRGTLLAAPDAMPARFRSGTTATARYALHEGASVAWFAPDGTVTGGES